MSKTKSKRVIMARSVARRYLRQITHPEYRLKVFHSDRVNNLPDLLRNFRDGQLRIGSVPPIVDLGIQEEFDTLSIWTSNREALLGLRDWLEDRGIETSGVW